MSPRAPSCRRSKFASKPTESHAIRRSSAYAAAGRSCTVRAVRSRIDPPQSVGQNTEKCPGGSFRAHACSTRCTHARRAPLSGSGASDRRCERTSVETYDAAGMPRAAARSRNSRLSSGTSRTVTRASRATGAGRWIAVSSSPAPASSCSTRRLSSADSESPRRAAAAAKRPLRSALTLLDPPLGSPECRAPGVQATSETVIAWLEINPRP